MRNLTLCLVLVCAGLVACSPATTVLAGSFDPGAISIVDPLTFTAAEHAAGIIGKPARDISGNDVGDVKRL